MNTSFDRLAHELSDRYRVEREIGAGGMAVVYAASDIKHNRQVAIKVLREELVTSSGASRFLREISIAARLQHPHILPLLDSGEAAGQLYYVMPFVDGESLRERMTRQSPVPIHEAVRILREVADALSHAHAHGVVHRDIKPDNVMLSGRHALVTDFGVARALNAAADQHERTSVGIALGTPSYMAPEQVAADPNTDHRADLYALGVMGYEMLAGRTPFPGLTPQQVLGAHISTPPPPIETLCADVPAVLAKVVMKCLVKNPNERWQSADEILSTLESLPTAEKTPPGIAGTRRVGGASRRRAVVAAISVAALAATALAVKGFRHADDLRATAAPLVIGKTTQFTSEDGLEIQPALSPDGNTIAFAAGNAFRMRIFVRPVRGGRTVPLSDDTTSVETEPRWSPDGSQLLYLSRGSLHIAPALGGESSALITRGARDSVMSATWSPDGKQIAFVRGDSLFAQPVAGGAPRFVGKAYELHSCVWSPVGERIACVSGNWLFVAPTGAFANKAPSSIVLFSLRGGAPHSLTDSTSTNVSPSWSSDGATLYYVSDRQGHRDVYALQLASDGTAARPAQRLTTGLGAQSLTLASNGSRMTYAVYRDQANIWFATLPAPNAEASLHQVTSGVQVIEAVRTSRDGRWLLFDSNVRGNAEIYRQRVPTGVAERLTNTASENFRPDLSPSGDEIAYLSWRTGNRDLYVTSLASGVTTPVTSTTGMQEAGPIWSPDGRALAFVEIAGHGLYIVRRDTARHWGNPVMRTLSNFGSPDWSPDGRSIAFVQEGSVRLIPRDTGAEKIIYSPRPRTDDPLAEQLMWNHDDGLLYFKSHDPAGRAMFWTLPVTGGRPRLVLRLNDLTHPSNRPDFAIAGRRLFFVIQDRQSDIWVADVSRK